ncbi:hypothetical protein N7676_00500 [Stenotrophomonas sp. GD03993]|uniref:hypothetical protein n=1 Tax=unclassified Stenotrophomonas TaxID=196198 RepID=UPI00244790F3|nr:MULTISPECIES: hypothetical protein [unclassified Stenotrophomonas]MDH0185926.1 hypothetical protein [Stenotrophomonas sp. GD04051]MDH0462292.1 hypothetical protein [Stenotrophomonas sp. GD03993]MDH0875095.1 hypothetical protein [Stenotrophomonas sp. GD03877]MDH2154629.1 hypothetical protein [Stenotrophomonas sp. GD03657]
MADGSRSFNFPPPQVSRLRPNEIVVNLFAGGGTVLKTTAQVRMCGLSVSPPPFYVLIVTNLDPVTLPPADAA